MIQISSKTLCCGCNACGDICPKQAITFETDFEGFWYPKVDESKCINCGLCEKVCPVVHAKELKTNDYPKPNVFAAHHKNLEIRFDSTSGGTFSALAEEIYKKGGFVGGAVYTEDFHAVQFISQDKADLARLRSSKYLQSNAEGFYKDVKKAVLTGLPVLVCGTPCQIAAIRGFLGKSYDNLYLVDFICHSIASPKAHRKYMDYLESVRGQKIVAFKAKNKELGWRMLTKKSTFADGSAYHGVRGQDLYSRAYHSKMIARPSCYDCRFKGYPRISDITLADFWGVERVAKEMDNDIGVSAVLVNSNKGKKLLATAGKRLVIKEVSLENVEPFNLALVQNAIRPSYDREQFFKDLDCLPFNEVGDKYFPIRKRRLNFIRTQLSSLKRFVYLTRLQPKAVFQFFHLNFLHKAIKTNWKNGHLLFPTPCCVFEIDKNSKVEVNGAILLGHKRFRKSKLESRFLVESGARVVFEGDFRFGYGCDVEVFKNAELTFGADSGGNIGLTLICGNKIHIGSHTFYGRDVSIRDTNGGHIVAIQGFKSTNPVTIGDFVWLCSECKIMAGVKIGDGTIVGSNSVVMQSLPAHVLVSGFPASVIDTNVYWKH